MAHKDRERADLDKSRMTLGEHLDELRNRLIRSTIAVFVAFSVGWAFHVTLAEIALRPYERSVAWLTEFRVEDFENRLAEDPELKREDFFVSADPAEPELRPEFKIKSSPRGDAASTGFFFYMRVCLYFALFVGGPFVLWQMWQFIAAGLYKKEKTMVHRYFPASVSLFVGGSVFGYFMMVPYALYFLARMSINQIEYWESIDNYWTFLTSLTLALGVVFQLPIVMLVLTRLGMIEPKTFSKFRGHFVLVALIAAAVLTPPDPFTQGLMAIPIIALYELGNFLSRMAVKRDKSRELTRP